MGRSRRAVYRIGQIDRLSFVGRGGDDVVRTSSRLRRRDKNVRMSMAAKKKPMHKNGFRKDEFIVYPTHGVGRIVGIEEQEIAGYRLELFVINFEKDKMTLRVPTTKCQSAGMRKLSDNAVVTKALETLRGRARVKRTMWSRRAQEYESKINSGSLISIAEVVRDLHRSDSQPEQSYSERQLYESALDRMAREIAAVQDVDEVMAIQAIGESLGKGPRMSRKEEIEEAHDEAA
ncbi:MAG: CarD family transcriptional regulator [Rhodomicrobiaceae bacterium]